MAKRGHGNGQEERVHLVRLFPDHPVRDGNVAFEFNEFAKTLAGLALNPETPTPFTVVVKGEWGRGKTTLLEETRRILIAEEAGSGYRRVKTLWFNAWKCPEGETVLAGLLGALLDALRGGDFWDQFRGLVSDYKGAAAWALLRTAFPGFFGEQEVPAGRLGAVHERRAFYDDFERLFRELSYAWFEPAIKSLRDLHGKSLDGKAAAVAVFLDDLDRCDEDRVLEVLKAVKLFLDLPGVCFYMGLNWERLKEILARTGDGREAEFLEKIVNIEMELPRISADGIESYMRGMIEATDLADIARHLPILARKAARRNPRHAKRFLNDLSLRLGLLRNTGKLGDGPRALPEAAVVSWHVLLEVLSDARAERLRRGGSDLDAFLEEYRTFLQTSDEKAGGTAEEERSVFRDEDVRTLLDTLLELNEEQRHFLVHLGSPFREAAIAKPPPRPARRGETEIEWISIPAGSFQMGSDEGDPDERPVHTVELSPYRISRFPITNRQYLAYVESTHAEQPSHWIEGKPPQGLEHHPVVHVSWRDAVAYCAWLAEESGARVDLPTEAQWEYAARGSDGRMYPWGEEKPTAAHANFNGDSTAPVDAHPEGVSPWGGEDMAGNVWEWCRDRFGPYRAGDVKDPVGPGSGERRVLRGGAFDLNARHLRAAYRNRSHPGVDYGYFGFRCVVLAPGGQSS